MSDDTGTARESAPEPERSRHQPNNPAQAATKTTRHAADVAAKAARQTAENVAESAQRIGDFYNELFEFGRANWAAWSNVQISNLHAAFGMQKATIQAAGNFVESAASAQRNMLNTFSDAVRKSEEVTSSMFSAGYAAVESAMSTGRR